MSAILAEVDTDGGPPIAIPFHHFAVATVFLLAGLGLGGISVFGGQLPIVGRPLVFAHVAQVHALLVGWVCLTIMGAMTQFIPVWSSVDLHSRRLAYVALGLVSVGVAGLVAGFSTVGFTLLAVSGTVALVGFWVFAYNIARTLASARPFDSVERHFAYALGFLVLATLLGFLLAVDFTIPVLRDVGLNRSNVVLSHATLAVFGIVLTTIFGAFGQLSEMFTQTTHSAGGRRLRQVEELLHPTGTVVFAGGRLLGVEWVALVGGLAIVAATLSFAGATAGLLRRMRVPWSTVLRRYAVAVVAMVVWALTAGATWVASPLSRTTLFGPPGATLLFGLGVVGFVVFGTLYHVVPFIVWVDRYSDDLGRRPVPMLDDLYRADVALADFGLLVGGTIVLLGAVGLGEPATGVMTVAGGGLLAMGVVAFVANLAQTVRNHVPEGVFRIRAA
ncbi:hypothetical protein C453_12601 [Haloferax elongans ATCC BAA-1513]|uniref:Cytochrome C oxidase subunit I n=1 Tax=Haloferax elongans ATCC BAA-1513 TaxID=1230453 RepID=M0HMD3_HALEO|nr:hypothetical protein [Haloferax elongans]ELZ84857.1 hypothetical protein C453_12601 [Haloferax elongans ATCC BAA-1513]